MFLRRKDRRLSMAVSSILGIAVLAMVGCGGTTEYEGEERAAVKGTVTLDGAPIAAGSITFKPSAGGSRVASAMIFDGQYELTEAKGPNLGNYSVEIYASASDTGLENEDPNVPAPKQAVPEKYNAQTTLNVEIVSGENVHDFPLVK